MSHVFRAACVQMRSGADAATNVETATALIREAIATTVVEPGWEAELTALDHLLLERRTARAITFGLHSPLRLPFRVAAKTGTSTSYRDQQRR